jgi:hypothetical protein
VRGAFLAVGLTILFSAPLSAQLSGSWRGTYTISIACANGSSFDSAGLAAAVLEESPDRDVTGTLTIAGIGNVPVKGTITIHPSETTTYTLTATGSDTASAYCSVTVESPATGRRRAVRH